VAPPASACTRALVLARYVRNASPSSPSVDAFRPPETLPAASSALFIIESRRNRVICERP